MPKKHTVENGGLVCDICNRIFNRRTAVLEHKKFIHHRIDLGKETCQIKGCDYKTGRVGNLHLHYKKVHGITLKKTKCFSPLCKTTRISEKSLISHMKKCANKPNFETISCDSCGEKMLTQEGMVTHNRIFHPEKIISNWNVTYEDLMNLTDIFNFN